MEPEDLDMTNEQIKNGLIAMITSVVAEINELYTKNFQHFNLPICLQRPFLDTSAKCQIGGGFLQKPASFGEFNDRVILELKEGVINFAKQKKSMKYILNILCPFTSPPNLISFTKLHFVCDVKMLGDIKKNLLTIDKKSEEDIVDALNRVLNYNTQDHSLLDSFSGIIKYSAWLESIMTEDEVLENI